MGDLRAALTATVCRQWKKKRINYWQRAEQVLNKTFFFFFEKRSKHLKHFEDANKENRRLRNQCNVVR